MFVYCRSAICTHAFVLWEKVTECDWQVPGTGEMGRGVKHAQSTLALGWSPVPRGPRTQPHSLLYKSDIPYTFFWEHGFSLASMEST